MPAIRDFWVGPLGALRALPGIPTGGDVGAGLDTIGTMRTGLDGTRSARVTARKRSWTPAWECLTEDEITYLDALVHGLLGDTIWLIDPNRRNRLAIDVAAGGSQRRDARSFSASTSITSWVSIADPPPGVPVAGGQAWTILGSQAAILQAGLSRPVPLLSGRGVRVLAWVRGGRAVSIGTDLIAADGSSSATVSTAITTQVSAWTELTMTLSPGPDRVAAIPRLQVASGSAAAMQVTGLALSDLDAPSGWTVGGGAAVVLVSPTNHSYPGPAEHSLAVTFLEA